MIDLTPEGLRERARHTAWSCGSTNRPDLVACHECIYDAFTALMTAARREQRERDAGVALLFMFKTGGKHSGQAYADIAGEIADAICAQEDTP